MLRKFFALVLMVCLLMMVGSAAAQDEPVTLSPEAQALVDAQAVLDENLSGRIVVWGWPAAIRDSLEASGVIAAFRRAYPKVEVEIVYYGPSDVYTNLPLALTAGTGACDVCLVETSNLGQFVYLGGLTDLSDWLTPYLDQFPASRLAFGQYEGEGYYAVPWDAGPVVMYYRRDVFERAGLPSEPEAVDALVATWEDYLAVCRMIQAEAGLPCFASNKAQNYGRLYEMMLWSRGLGYYDLATGEVTVDSAENIATLEKLGVFWDEGLVSDSLEWTDAWYAEFSSLEAPAATIIIASWMEVFMKSWLAPGTEGLWGSVRMPAFAEGEARAANDGGSNFVIPEQSTNKEAAWRFIEFTLLDRTNQLAIYNQSGFFPSLETTYDDDNFLAADPFFAGQVTGELYAAVFSQIPTVGIYGPDYSLMNSAVSLAVQRFASGDVSAAEALADAAEEIRASIQ